MSPAPAVRLLVVAAGVGVVVAAANRLRGPQAPVFLAPPTSAHGLLQPARDRSAPSPPALDHPAVDGITSPAAEPASGLVTGAASELVTGAASEMRSGARSEGPNPPGQRWVFPLEDGRCPPDHPIKAKLRSGLFHEPGMAAYERTHADRCYATAVDAEADGLRRAKR